MDQREGLSCTWINTCLRVSYGVGHSLQLNQRVSVLLRYPPVRLRFSLQRDRKHKFGTQKLCPQKQASENLVKKSSKFENLFTIA